MSQRTKWIISSVLIFFAVVFAVRAMWGGEDIDELADSKDENDRLQAVLILQQDQSDSAEMLGRLAGDSSPQVAMQAITAMGRHRTNGHRRKLTQIIGAERNPAVKGAAAAAIGHYKETTVGELTQLMGRSENRQVRVGAAKGLARLARHNRKTTGPALVAALRDPDPEVRIWAITGIYHLCSHKFPGYDAAKDPRDQAGVISFIERELREKGLI